MFPSTEMFTLRVHIAYVYQSSSTLPHIHSSIPWATCNTAPGISLILLYHVTLTVVLIPNTTDSCTLVPCSCSAFYECTVYTSSRLHSANHQILIVQGDCNDLYCIIYCIILYLQIYGYVFSSHYVFMFEPAVCLGPFQE